MEVKSFLVVRAKAVRAMTTAEVMPRARRTMSVLYLMRDERVGEAARISRWRVEAAVRGDDSPSSTEGAE